MSRLTLLAGVAALTCLAGLCPAGDDVKSLPIKLVTHKVKPEKLQTLIIERGAVESANNNDIVCQVKTGINSTGASTVIKQVLVEDGDTVKKGQLLLELDASGLEDQLKTQQIARDAAKSARDQTEATWASLKSSTESELETAKITLQFAEMSLEKYLKGDFVQSLQDIKMRQTQAEADTEERKGALEQAERKLKQKQITESQVRVARLRLDAARLAQEKIQLELQVLQKYLKPQQEMQFQAAVTEARRSIGRLEQTAKAREAQASQDLAVKKALYEQEITRYREIESEIAKCKLYAPRDGLVVYYIPEQPRRGLGQEPIVAVGEPVREGQKLMSIPDLSKMQVVARVPEALITQIKLGQAATAQVDAYPDRKLRGRVSRIATTPSPRDWLTSDVKVYPVVIAIEGDLEGLLPGMTASVTLDPGKQLDNVLTVPIQSVIGRGSIGRTVSCLVLTANGPEEREIVVGPRGEKFIAITSGLKEGDEVIVNPRLLLNDLRDRIRFLQSGRTPPRRE